MTINSKPYGQIEIDERQVITFPVGLFGFENLHSYALLDATQKPFYWLQSLDSEKIAFILIKPSIFRPDYDPKIGKSELSEINLDKKDYRETALLFSIVNIPPGEQNKMTANLQGPIVINKDSRIGGQFISQDNRWKVKHFILEELNEQRKESAC